MGYKHTNTQTQKHKNTQTHTHTNTQTHKHTNTQTHKHTNTRTHKHTNSQTYIHRRSTYIQIHTSVQNYEQNTHLGIRGLRYRLDGSGIVITRYLFAHIAPNENYEDREGSNGGKASRIRPPTASCPANHSKNQNWLT